jgi:hypothetical protein
MKRRRKRESTEECGSDRWDLPRIPGGHDVGYVVMLMQPVHRLICYKYMYHK